MLGSYPLMFSGPLYCSSHFNYISDNECCAVLILSYMMLRLMFSLYVQKKVFPPKSSKTKKTPTNHIHYTIIDISTCGQKKKKRQFLWFTWGGEQMNNCIFIMKD